MWEEGLLLLVAFLSQIFDALLMSGPYDLLRGDQVPIIAPSDC